MLHIEVIHSNADAPYRLEDGLGAEFILKVIHEQIPESMFKSKELLDFVAKTYGESNLHLSYQNIASRAKEASEKFDPEDIAYIFSDLMHVDEQLYYDIMNMIYNAINSKDTCAAGEFARNLRISTDAEILSIIQSDENNNGSGCDETCDGCDGSCGCHDQEVITAEDREEYEDQVNKAMARCNS